MTVRNENGQQANVICEILSSRDDVKNKIQDRIQKGLNLNQRKINSLDELDSFNEEYKTWNEFNIELLKRSFTNSDFMNEYLGGKLGFIIGFDESLGEKIASHRRRVQSKIRCLESIVERLELVPIHRGDIVSSKAFQATTQTRTNKVFVVHGRDEVAKTNLEVFLREIKLEPIVLHRQADVGQTVIEKFEANSDVGFAFILLTPDDVAYLKQDDDLPDDERKKELRARQNVMFEFGYFVGKLGRSKVCCLYTGDVTIPSDLNGLIYKKYNSSIEEVAYSILKDLKATGYDV